MEILPLRTRKDNYSYLLLPDNASHTEKACAAVVDPGEAEPIEEKLQELDMPLGWVLITHHHADHIAGVPRLLKTYPNAKVLCSEHDKSFLPGDCIILQEEQLFTFDHLSFEVLFTPCHSPGHIVFYFQNEKALFSGDTLFVAGCGRFFDGTAKDMYENFQKIQKLPIDTKIYCGHEYTVRGLTFSLQIEPSNNATKRKLDAISSALEQGEFSVPTTLADELETNVFLRTDSKEVQQTVEKKFNELKNDPVWLLARVRELKDKS